MQLRYYQQGAMDCVTRYMERMPGNPCVELPTGAGKTPLAAALARHYCTSWPDTRILVLAHVKELVKQNHDGLRRMWPEGDLGIFSASLGKRDAHNQVVFANIQSVYDKALHLGRFDLAFVDEAHRIPAADQGMYRRLINDLKGFNPHFRVIGFTATPYRLDSGDVCGDDTVLSEIVYRADVAKLIDEGFLCRPVTKAPMAPNLDGVKIVAGDYSKRQLESAVEQIVEATVDDLVVRAAERKAWVIFAAGANHAKLVQTLLRDKYGLDFPLVLDSTPRRDRDRIVEEYKACKHRGLININIFSEGFDAPHVDCVVMMRPTKSPGMYYQQVGRGFRIHPSKADFLVLDYAGNILEHGPIDRIQIGRKGKGGDSEGPLMKVCPACDSPVLLSASVCLDCGHEFPPPTPKAPHADKPSEAALLASEAAVWHHVVDWALSKHEKPGKQPSLMVSYQIGLTRVREWQCFEHGGMPRVRALGWWQAVGGESPPPRTIDEALRRQGELRPPERIKVLMTGKFPEVIAMEAARVAA